MSTVLDIAAQIRGQAGQFGFDQVRFAPLVPAPGIDEYDQFLSEKRQGDMEWMVRSRGPRAEPLSLLPTARSAIVLGMSYAHPRPPDPGGLTGKVASYAWGRDYHNLIGKRLRKLARELQRQIPGFEAYWGVDSRPLIERAWAERSGLGFLGKNCMAIMPAHSSYFFLAVILVNVDLPPDSPLKDHCGSCTRCLDACPTNAFTGPGQLDARRCISYLTIEHRSEIPEHLRPLLGRWVFGCDDCQEVCPHNGQQFPDANDDFGPRRGHAWLDLEWVLQTTDDQLDKHFEGSPIRRCKPVGLKRNAAIVLGNLADPAARSALLQAHGHSDVRVSEAAQWALDKI